QAGEERDAVAGGPGVAIAIARDVVDPAFRNDRRTAARAPLHEQLADARQIARRRAHASRAAWGAQAIHRDVGAARSAEGPPEQLAHEIGIALPGRALDDPAEQIRVRRDVVERPAVWPRRLRQLAIERAQVRGSVAGLERIPVAGLAVRDDWSRDCQIVLVEGDARAHVEEVAD